MGNEERLNKDLRDDAEDSFLEEEDTQKDRYLTFRIGEEDYAIEIQFVMEINRIQKITEVPDTADYVRGVINLRGKIIPVIDVRTRFHLAKREYDDRTCIIVVTMNEVLTGLIVDRVNEVLDIPENQIDPAPKTGKRGDKQYIKGMGKVGEKVKIVLDVNRLLSDEERQELEAIQQGDK